MATADTNQLERFGTKTAEIFEKARVMMQQTGGQQSMVSNN